MEQPTISPEVAGREHAGERHAGRAEAVLQHDAELHAGAAAAVDQFPARAVVISSGFSISTCLPAAAQRASDVADACWPA